jgi:hypothetical protein
MADFYENSCGVPSEYTDCVLIAPNKYYAITTKKGEVLDYSVITSPDPYGVMTCNRVGYEDSDLLLYVGNTQQAYEDNGNDYLTSDATLVQFMPCNSGSYRKGLYYGIRTQSGIYSSPIIQKAVNTAENVLGSDYILNGSILIVASFLLVWYLYGKLRSSLY